MTGDVKHRGGPGSIWGLIPMVVIVAVLTAAVWIIAGDGSAISDAILDTVSAIGKAWRGE